ncbi:hypothetical protein QBC37DRAFT_325535 [Rhypophila decipiens]|uniref:DUF6536 domain-containing protein n=1 Tax=Rhypophila decipiens TaxID=261697 RepID=A0AAN6XX52_9PEZI|nr:hypothetical protein QBC37DRAFT_325535 [Rhypophila decipiens]
MGENLNPRRSSITWPVGVQTALFVVVAILLTNAAITMWTSITMTVSDGIGTLHVGPCEEVKQTGLGLHILINFLCTSLLGASNFCMQCLSSPTRDELDEQHAQKRWLEIGVLSVRNLKSIARRRVWLWFVLGASSFPIHLLFNSAIFVNLTANEYTVALVTNDFVKGARFSVPENVASEMAPILVAMQQNLSTPRYERLESVDCIKAYKVDFLSDRRNVAVVAVQTDEEPSPFLGYMKWTYNKIQNSWVCGGNITDEGRIAPEDIDDYDCTAEDALESLPIAFGDYEMDYCLSERVRHGCHLQFSLPIMLIVICCNTAKAVAIAIMLSKKEITLLTLGDAIASFLDRPDPTTRGMCTLTMKDVKSGYWPDNPEASRWQYSKHFRWEAVGLWRWVGSNVFTCMTLGAFSFLLYCAIETTTTNPDLMSWYNLGFGVVTSSSLVRWDPKNTRMPYLHGGNTSLMRNVLLANSPQLLLSAMYLVYNQAYTCMAFADEWAAYFPHADNTTQSSGFYTAQPHKQLRLSPKLNLSLPLRYTIPLLLLSGVTHFLLSQSFFLVTISIYDANLSNSNSTLTTSPESGTLMTVGFSPIAMIILFLVLSTSVLFLGLGLGFRRLKKGMPLVGSCSAALSAACHIVDGPETYETGEEIARAPQGVLWGVTGGSEGGVGHLGFSAGFVGEPVPGRMYR